MEKPLTVIFLNVNHKEKEPVAYCEGVDRDYLAIKDWNFSKELSPTALWLAKIFWPKDFEVPTLKSATSLAEAGEIIENAKVAIKKEIVNINYKLEERIDEVYFEMVSTYKGELYGCQYKEEKTSCYIKSVVDGYAKRYATAYKNLKKINLCSCCCGYDEIWEMVKILKTTYMKEVSVERWQCPHGSMNFPRRAAAIEKASGVGAMFFERLNTEDFYSL